MNPYSTIKLLHHPQAIEAIQQGRHQPPIQVHFMPMLACNQHCFFCSYGHRTQEDGEGQLNWKNMELMSNAAMPREKMFECLRDWVEMGVKAVEVTGGGEPLLHPDIDDWFEACAQTPLEVGLVTNGTALIPQRADKFLSTNWKWARVSIDSGTPESYVATRRVNKGHWFRAWDAVRYLSAHIVKPEQQVGVGYVVDTHNWDEVYAGCVQAKAAGATNIRIAFAFTPQGLERLPSGAVENVESQIKAAARDLDESGKFQVVGLFSERVRNVLDGRQTYKMCGVKEVVCVVGGDLGVYTCCTLAFNRAGVIGTIVDRSFKELWNSDATIEMFKNHDARRVCQVPCLYEKRNKAILNIIRKSPTELEQLRTQDNPTHVNFI